MKLRFPICKLDVQRTGIRALHTLSGQFEIYLHALRLHSRSVDIRVEEHTPISPNCAHHQRHIRTDIVEPLKSGNSGDSGLGRFYLYMGNSLWKYYPGMPCRIVVSYHVEHIWCTSYIIQWKLLHVHSKRPSFDAFVYCDYLLSLCLCCNNVLYSWSNYWARVVPECVF